MHCLLVAAALAALVPLSTAQDVPAPGFALEAAPLPAPSFFTTSTTLSDGDFVLFDGARVTRHASDGTLLVELGALVLAGFPSFLVADEGERFVYFNESSAGRIYRLPADRAGVPELIATLPFGYDATLSGRFLYVSAATCGFSCGNEIWRVDLSQHRGTLPSSGAVLLATVPGGSGPLVASPSGELYYASVSGDFPPPTGHASVWKWTRAEAEGGQLLSLADADLLGSGFEGAARLAHDRRERALYLAEVNFATGENRIRRVGPTPALSPVLVEGRAFLSIGSLSFHEGAGAARFRAFQPASGGVLTYATTDFFSLAERFHVRPARPQAELGVPAPLQLAVSLSGGPPGGFARLYLGPRALLPAEERIFVLGGVPLFLGLDLATHATLPDLVPLDENGGYADVLPDPGGVAGEVAVQLLLLGPDLEPVGTSNVAVL